MNPISSVMQIVGAASGLIGMAVGTVAQVGNLHRQWRPPAQVAQAQCQPPRKLEVLVIDGQKQLACVLDEPAANQ